METLTITITQYILTLRPKLRLFVEFMAHIFNYQIITQKNMDVDVVEIKL